MAIELARTQVLRRPWGVVGLRPWNKTDHSGLAVGEIWYERPGRPLLSPALLFKLQFTSQPLERIDLAPNWTWRLEAKRQTRLLVLSGGGVAGSFADAVFAQSDHVDVHAGKLGMVGLAAYTDVGPVPHLLPHLKLPGSTQLREPQKVQVSTSLPPATAATNSRLEPTI